MKLLRKKNVLTLQDGTKYKVNSPAVNDILNKDCDVNEKYMLLDMCEKKYKEHFQKLGDKINNYTKGQFVCGFGALITLTSYGIVSGFTEGFWQTIALTGGVTAMVMCTLGFITDSLHYEFTKPADYPTYINMKDFGVAKQYLTDKIEKDEIQQ